MSERVDRRVVRTKRLIRDAFAKLMEEKGFEGVTVRDITTTADINRGTFYLHYRDKYDLLQQSEDEVIGEIDEIGQRIKELGLKDIRDFHARNVPLPFVLKLFEYLQENHAFVKVILVSQGNHSFQEKLKKVIKKNMLQNMEKKLKKEDMLVPVDYLIAYIMSAHIGIIQHWLETGMELSPREISLTLAKLTYLGPGYVAGIKR